MLQTSPDAQDPPASPPSLASWYAAGLSDGLGDRLLMFDNSGAPSLELLRFRPDLADTPHFESALREQVQRLSRFQHPAFARVRSVQRLEPDGDLALVSNHTPGKRLSEILHRAHGPAFAAAMLKQLVPAVAELQQHHPGTLHGLLGPDRVVVSPDAQLTIVEHVVAPAIASVGLDARELSALGISVPPGSTVPQLTPSTDWYQLGLVILSAALGRPVISADLPVLDVLVSQAVDAAVRDAAGVSPLLREWLERSLKIDGSGIESPAEARALVAALTGDRRSTTPRVLPMRTAHKAEQPRVEPGRTMNEQEPPVVQPDVLFEPEPAPAAAPRWTVDDSRPAERPIVQLVEPAPDALVTDFPAESEQPAPALAEAVLRDAPSARPPAAAPARPNPGYAAAPAAFAPGSFAAPAFAASAAAQELSPFEREVLAGRIPGATVPHAPAFGERVEPAAPRRFGPLAMIAAGQAVVLVWLAGSAWLSNPPAFGMQAAGSNEHVLTRNGQPAAGPVAVAVGPELSWVRTTMAPEITVPGAKPSDGTLRISSPVPVKVIEGTKTLGSIPGADLKLAPVRHDLELVNEGLDYKLAHSVEVTGGENIHIQLAPRPGTLTLEAAVGTEVTIDGKSIGRTPMPAISLAPGVYDVVFKYAKGASDKQRVTVKPDAATSVAAKAR